MGNHAGAEKHRNQQEYGQKIPSAKLSLRERVRERREKRQGQDGAAGRIEDAVEERPDHRLLGDDELVGTELQPDREEADLPLLKRYPFAYRTGKDKDQRVEPCDQGCRQGCIDKNAESDPAASHLVFHGVVSPIRRSARPPYKSSNSPLTIVCRRDACAPRGCVLPDRGGRCASPAQPAQDGVGRQHHDGGGD